MRIYYYIVVLFLFYGFSCHAQQYHPLELKNNYEAAYQQLKDMLEGKEELSFKKAVFTVENAYYNNTLNEEAYHKKIKEITNIAKLWTLTNHLVDYPYPDSMAFKKNAAVFTVMTDTVFLTQQIPVSYPYEYDFEDFFGEQDWSKMFVTKLLETGTGNCHSMPYLYKILAEEMGTAAYLSFAPNHIYIKQRSKKCGWYNTELTSKMFPIDAWLMATGYIDKTAVVSGMYMEALTDEHSIACCLIDLANGYERQFNYITDGFALKCCELALTYYPKYTNALLLKQKILKRQFDNILKRYSLTYPSEAFHMPEAKNIFSEMESTTAQLLNMGYREIPQEVYFMWLSDLSENKEKYQNKQLKY